MEGQLQPHVKCGTDIWTAARLNSHSLPYATHVTLSLYRIGDLFPILSAALYHYLFLLFESLSTSCLLVLFPLCHLLSY